MNKINILRGEWAYSESSPYLESVINKHNIPLYNQEMLPLYQLKDNEYWHQVHSDIGYLDFRHWYYSDEIFMSYIDQITKARLYALKIAEFALADKPEGISLNTFVEKLRKRTRNVVQLMKRKSPETIILSPAIVKIDENIHAAYLSYFSRSVDLFDVYSVHCDITGAESEIAVLTSFLNQVLTIHRKQTWITKWCIPSSNDDIQSNRLGKLPAALDSVSLAAKKFVNTFDAVDRVCRSDTIWFYTGAGQDLYNSEGIAPDSSHMWCDMDFEREGWNYNHFMGILDHAGEPKKPIVTALHGLVTKYDI